MKFNSTSSFFGVTRDAAGNWSTEHTDSYYASKLDSHQPLFTVGNGSVLAAVTPSGTIAQFCGFGPDALLPHERYAGGWVTWPRIVAGPVTLNISLEGDPENSAGGGPCRTSYLCNSLPLTEHRCTQLDVQSVVFAPLSEDGEVRPRALLWMVTLQNRLDEALTVMISASSEKGALVFDAVSAEDMRNKSQIFDLPPRQQVSTAMMIVLEGGEAVIAGVSKHSPADWLDTTLAYWQRITGQFAMPGDRNGPLQSQRAPRPGHLRKPVRTSRSFSAGSDESG